LSDEDDQDDIATDKKQSRRKSAAIYNEDGDDFYGHSDKKQLLNGSDFDMKIPTPGGLKE
jgi:hypothetical protein